MHTAFNSLYSPEEVFAQASVSTSEGQPKTGKNLPTVKECTGTGWKGKTSLHCNQKTIYGTTVPLLIFVKYSLTSVFVASPATTKNMCPC